MIRRLGPALFVFLGVLGTVTTLLHGYAWLRLVRDPGWPEAVTLAATALLVLLAVAMPAAVIGARGLPKRWAQPAGWVSYVWLGAIFYLDVTLLVLDGGRMLFEGVAHASVGSVLGSGDGPIEAPALAVVASLIAFGLVGAGAMRGLGRPIVRQVTVPIHGLPAAFEGTRIVQLTDIHVGPVIRRAFVEKLVKEVAALEPDLIAITGDLVDGSVAELASEVAPLAELSAPLGTFFVTGNHEYFSGADAWSEHVASLGIPVLRNRHVELEKEGSKLTLAGIDDAHAARFGGVTDLGRALEGRDVSLPVILLAHQPRSIEHASKAGVALQISGHTHGGQMQPFGALVRIEQPFLRGLHKVGDTAIWVSEGTGTWGPPLRVGIERSGRCRSTWSCGP